MALYSIHLGVRWDAVQYGAPVLETVPEQDARVLQFVAAGPGGQPSWFQFPQGTEAQFYLWDLSASPMDDSYTKEAWLVFGYLDSSEIGTIAPSVVLKDTEGQREPTGSGSRSEIIPPERYRFTTIVKDTSGVRNPWSTSVAPDTTTPKYNLGTVTFQDKDMSFEMMFVVRVSPGDGSWRNYVGDPEGIVGRGGDPR
ncbi:hypothetical protein [Haliangium sp.]|uniref:hypothetical protein n=1 Tax=Haliangium sp. TaxID=2663208 RepID=UPI003D0CA6F4